MLASDPILSHLVAAQVQATEFDLLVPTEKDETTDPVMGTNNAQQLLTSNIVLSLLAIFSSVSNNFPFVSR